MEAVFPKQIKFVQWTFIKYLYLRQEKKVKLSWLLNSSIFLLKIPVRKERTSASCFSGVHGCDVSHGERKTLNAQRTFHWAVEVQRRKDTKSASGLDTSPWPLVGHGQSPLPPTHTGHPQSSLLIPPSCCKVSFLSAVFFSIFTTHRFILVKSSPALKYKYL